MSSQIQVVQFFEDGRVVCGASELLTGPEAGVRAVWIDLEGQNTENRDLIGRMGFHPLAVEDTFTLHHQPRVEEYDDSLFIIVRGLNFNTKGDRLDTLKLAAFLRADCLVTYHREPLRSIEAVRHRLAETHYAPRGGLAHLLYLVYNELISYYHPVIDDIATDIEELEEEIFRDPKPVHLEQIWKLRSQLSTVRKVMLPHRQVFNHLATGSPEEISDSEALYYRDVFDQILHVIDVVDLQREQLSTLRDLYLSSISQRTNDIMRVLTVISAIILPMTLIAGIYGMNFQHMPELALRWAYPAALSLMLAVGAGMAIFSKRKGWW